MTSTRGVQIFFDLTVQDFMYVCVCVVVVVVVVFFFWGGGGGGEVQ